MLFIECSKYVQKYSEYIHQRPGAAAATCAGATSGASAGATSGHLLELVPRLVRLLELVPEID